MDTAERSGYVDALIRARRAVRAFDSRPVDRQTVVEILEIARHAPSNSNLQPWYVYVLSGENKLALSRALTRAHTTEPNAHGFVYDPFPHNLGGKFQTRRQDFGVRYYGLLGIELADQPGRHAQTGRNFDFFGAPIGLIFAIDSSLERTSWLDCGLFIQNIMLLAKARGLDTCPQMAFAKYHRVIREELDLPENEIVVCGMSLGYADSSAPVNTLTIPRAGVYDFATFVGFP